MILNFRQGLVSFQLSGSQPRFLMPSSTPGYIDLSISPTPFIATIAHGSSNYLLKFDETISAAFGPLSAGSDNYLFIELDVLTGEVTHGVSRYETIVSPTEPASSAAGMMWFDMAANVMKVRNANNTKYLETPRVVVGKALNGNTSQIVPSIVGSSVGLNAPCKAGFILLDTLRRPVRTSTGELMTTDTTVSVKTTVGTSGVLSQPLNAFVPVRAAEPIPQMRLVYFSGGDAVSLASSDPALLNLKTPVGVVQSPLALNELGVITQNGEITWDQWNFDSASFGKPLYCGWNGEITTTRPQNYQVYRVGFVKNANTVLMNIDSETQAQVVSQAGTLVIGAPPIVANTATNLAGELITSISIPEASPTSPGHMTAAQASQVASFDVRITNTESGIITLTSTKAGVIHSHAQSDVIGLTTGLNDLNIAVLGKIDKVPSAAASHFAALTSAGTLVDAGLGAVDFALAAHTHVIADTTNLQAELNNRALVNHTHSIAQVSTLQAALDGKALIVHGHVIADMAGLQLALDSKAPMVHGHIVADVAGLQGFLDSKAPTVHGHAIGEVTGLQLALDSKAPMVHGHIVADVAGLQLELDGKALTVHGHVVADVAGLQLELDGKALTVHGHAIGEVTGLQLALDSKAPTVHGHIVADVAGLQLELDGKAAISHSHSLAAGSITDVDTSTTAPLAGQVLTWDGISLWVPSNVSAPPASAQEEQSFILTSTNPLGGGTYNNWSQWEPYSIAVPHVTWDSYMPQFVLASNGVFIFSISASVNAYNVTPDDATWPDGMTAFGFELVRGSAGVPSIFAPARTVHTRLGDASNSSNSNSSLSTTSVGQRLQTPTWTDEFMIQGTVGDALSLYGFVEKYNTGGMIVDTTVRVTIRKISSSQPI